MTSRGGSRARQRGAVAVEFALILPLFLTLVLGAIDWGWYFFIDQLVSDCAREGARAGSLLPPRPTSTPAQAEAAAQQAGLTFLQRAHLTPQGVDAHYTTVDGDDAVLVTVTYPVGSLTGLLSNLVPANARATVVMRWQ
jgi:Flp pilus assembly protein TadG